MKSEDVKCVMTVHSDLLKRCIYSAITMMLLLFIGGLFPVPSSASSQPEITILIDGQIQSFDTAPEIIEGTTFVPMRGIFEALGADVKWNNARREAVAEKDGKEIILKINSKTVFNDSQLDTLLQAPYIKNERTMMPLRYIGEALGYDVKWDGTTRTITIDSDTTSAGDDSALLSYDDSIARAIEVSPNCKSAHLTYKQANQQLKEFQGLYGGINEFFVWQNRKDLTIYRSWAEKSIITTEEQTAYTAVSDMDQISLKKLEIERKQDNVAFIRKQVDQAKLKYDVGMISYKDYLNAKSSYESACRELDTLNTELTGLYTKLNGLLEYDNNQRDIPEFSVNYESAADYDIDQLIDEELKNDPYIWYVEQNLDSAKFKLETYEYNSPTSTKSHTLTALDMQEAKNNVEKTKKNFDTVLRSRYNSLLQLESSMASLETGLEQLRENLDTVRSTYDAGMTTKIQLEELLQSKADLEYQLQALKVSHSLTRTLLEKPYLAPEYMAS